MIIGVAGLVLSWLSSPDSPPRFEGRRFLFVETVEFLIDDPVSDPGFSLSFSFVTATLAKAS